MLASSLVNFPLNSLANSLFEKMAESSLSCVSSFVVNLFIGLKVFILSMKESTSPSPFISFEMIV